MLEQLRSMDVVIGEDDNAVDGEPPRPDGEDRGHDLYWAEGVLGPQPVKVSGSLRWPLARIALGDVVLEHPMSGPEDPRPGYDWDAYRAARDAYLARFRRQADEGEAAPTWTDGGPQSEGEGTDPAQGEPDPGAGRPDEEDA